MRRCIIKTAAFAVNRDHGQEGREVLGVQAVKEISGHHKKTPGQDGLLQLTAAVHHSPDGS